MSPPESYPHTREIALRWNDSDIYGHVNNVEYYAHFDTVINAYLIQKGGLDIHGGAAIGLCAESHCTFTAPISFPETILAGLRVGAIGRSSVRYELGLFNARDEQPLADGWFVHVFVDRAGRRPTSIPPPIREALQLLA